jgi:hypothetical protein
MKHGRPVWTLAALAIVVALDAVIILITSGPIACHGSDGSPSGLGAALTIFALGLLVGGPAVLIAVGLREARGAGAVLAYAVTACGVPIVIVLSIWAIGSAFGAASCGSSPIMGG